VSAATAPRGRPPDSRALTSVGSAEGTLPSGVSLSISLGTMKASAAPAVDAESPTFEAMVPMASPPSAASS
jgi:hypothetical protein